MSGGASNGAIVWPAVKTIMTGVSEDLRGLKGALVRPPLRQERRAGNEVGGHGGGGSNVNSMNRGNKGRGLEREWEGELG